MKNKNGARGVYVASEILRRGDVRDNLTPGYCSAQLSMVPARKQAEIEALRHDEARGHRGDIELTIRMVENHGPPEFGHCVYQMSDGRCAIYWKRPEACRVAQALEVTP